MGRVGIRITSAALTRQYISFAPYTSSSAKKSSETKTRSVFSPFPPFSRFFRNPHFASQIRWARRERKLCLSLLSIVYRLPMPSIPSCCVVVESASQLFSSPPSVLQRIGIVFIFSLSAFDFRDSLAHSIRRRERQSQAQKCPRFRGRSTRVVSFGLASSEDWQHQPNNHAVFVSHP